MAENSNADNEDIENPIPEPEMASDADTTSNASQIVIVNSESENMETHAHHIHNAPGKKIWHYFYEFLMLFFAVFCGFLAENWREHYIEHQREKVYAGQLLADMRADSLSLSRAITDFNGTISKQNAFIRLLSSSEIATDKEVVRSFAYMQWIYIPTNNQSTYNQMKSSGSLRYIRNKILLKDLQKYYEIDLPFLENIAKENLDVYNKYIVPFSLEHFTKGDTDIITDSLINKNPIYRNRTPDSDFKLRNIIFLYKEYLSITSERFLPIDIQRNSELIKMLKKEYNLK